MSKTQEQSKRVATGGFTIIEVVLVLAIAGLIFLMVFIALPSLQRSQRDAQRKDDLSRFLSQVSSYQSNNRGAVPTTAGVGTFVNDYLKADGDTFQDPQSGQQYTIQTLPDRLPKAGATSNNIYYVVGKDVGCVDGKPHIVSGSTSGRNIAVSMGLEGGGAYCQEN